MVNPLWQCTLQLSSLELARRNLVHSALAPYSISSPWWRESIKNEALRRLRTAAKQLLQIEGMTILFCCLGDQYNQSGLASHQKHIQYTTRYGFHRPPLFQNFSIERQFGTMSLAISNSLFTPKTRHDVNSIQSSLENSDQIELEVEYKPNIRVVKQILLRPGRQHRAMLAASSHGLTKILVRALSTSRTCTLKAWGIMDISLNLPFYIHTGNFFDREARLPNRMNVTQKVEPPCTVHVAGKENQKAFQMETPDPTTSSKLNTHDGAVFEKALQHAEVLVGNQNRWVSRFLLKFTLHCSY